MSFYFILFFLFSFMDQSSTKTQQGKLQTPCPMSKGLDGSLELPFIPGLLTAAHLSLLGWIQSLYAALTDRSLMALTSTTS